MPPYSWHSHLSSERLAVKLSLPVLRTLICRNWDSNTQPSACEVNSLTNCTTSTAHAVVCGKQRNKWIKIISLIRLSVFLDVVLVKNFINLQEKTKHKNNLYPHSEEYLILLFFPLFILILYNIIYLWHAHTRYKFYKKWHKIVWILLTNQHYFTRAVNSLSHIAANVLLAW